MRLYQPPLDIKQIVLKVAFFGQKYVIPHPLRPPRVYQKLGYTPPLGSQNFKLIGYPHPSGY